MCLSAKEKDGFFANLAAYMFYEKFAISSAFKCYFFIVKKCKDKIWMLNLQLVPIMNRTVIHNKKIFEIAKKYGALVKYEE